MCDLCKESEDGCVYCQDCGRMICFDYKTGDDIIRPACVSESGDLFCDLCGPDYDEDSEYDKFDDNIEPLWLRQ